MSYGTILEVTAFEMLPDGRSLVETIGRERFRISDWSVRDGYIIARTHVLPDLEPTMYVPPSPPVRGMLSPAILRERNAEEFGTVELVWLTRCFVEGLRNVEEIGRSPRGRAEVEGMIEELDRTGDAVKFGWWVGSKLPLREDAGYELLLQSGVREIYLLLGNWIGEMERQTWYVALSP